MALRFIESFSHYATADITKKWTTTGGSPPTIGSNTGRRGTGAAFSTISPVTFAAKSLDNQATWIVGFALKSPLSSSGALLGFCDSAPNTTLSVQTYLTLSTGGVLSMVRGAGLSPVLLGSSSAGVISANTWYYIEVKVTISDASGAYEVRVNGTNVLSGSSADTKQTTNAYANIISFFSVSTGGTGVTAGDGITSTYVSDIYICDGTGSAPYNDFLGDCRVDAYIANGAGNSSQFTPSAGSNYQNVDDSTPDSDTTYNESNTVGHIDLYTMADMTHTPVTIFGTQTCLFVGKSDAGTRTVRAKCRSGGSNYDGSTVSPSVDYGYSLNVRTVDPATNAAWTKSGLNAAEFGIEVVS